MAIEIISSLDYAPVRSIISFESFPDHTAKVVVEEWKSIPMNPASGEMQTRQGDGPSGQHYSTTISARIKQALKPIDACIIKLVLCSGKELIIGTPGIPAIIISSSTLSGSRMNIEYDNIMPPLELLP